MRLPRALSDAAPIRVCRKPSSPLATSLGRSVELIVVAWGFFSTMSRRSCRFYEVPARAVFYGGDQWLRKCNRRLTIRKQNTTTVTTESLGPSQPHKRREVPQDRHSVRCVAKIRSLAPGAVPCVATLAEGRRNECPDIHAAANGLGVTFSFCGGRLRLAPTLFWQTRNTEDLTVGRKDTKERLIELRTLAECADKNIYRRVHLVASILTDRGWIEDEYEGCEWLAMDDLETRYFASLAGYVTLPVMLAIYSKFPAEEEWEKYKYDLRAMEILWEESRKVEGRQTTATIKPRATHADVDEAKDDAKVQKSIAAKFERAAEQAKSLAETSGDEVERLSQRVAELEIENTNLKAQVVSLESVIDKYMAQE